MFKIIKRSRKGVDVPELMKKTGFGGKKDRGIVFKVIRQGKIEGSGGL